MTTIDDWFDERTLLDLVPPPVFLQGASAVENGAVRVIERDDQHIAAGGGPRDLRGRVPPGGRPAGVVVHLRRGRGHPCEHLLATALWTWPGEAPDDE